MSWDRAIADETLAQAAELLAWAGGGRVDAEPPPRPAEASAWDRVNARLQTGVVPTHEEAAKRSRRSVFASVVLLGLVFLAIAALLAVSGALDLAAGVFGVAALFLVPPGYVLHRLGARAKERLEAGLVVEAEGVRRTAHDGSRRLVPWSEIAGVEEHVLGRYTFRDARGETLFTLPTFASDDAKLAKAIAAAARAGGLGEASAVEIGAHATWALAIVGGPLLAMVGLAALAAPALHEDVRLEALEHRVGVVSELERVVSGSGSVRLELEHDDFAFYVVRGRARALAVLDAVEVGDEVELWHDRAERSFGSIGAVHQLAVGDRILFRAEDEARESAAVASRDRRVALPMIAAGLLLWAAGMFVQRRRAVLTLR